VDHKWFDTSPAVSRALWVFLLTLYKTTFEQLLEFLGCVLQKRSICRSVDALPKTVFVDRFGDVFQSRAKVNLMLDVAFETVI
jgi:hypothetical protein